MSPSAIIATTRKSPFTIENMPYGVISTEANPRKRRATAFQDSAVDLAVLEEHSLFRGIPSFEQNVFSQVLTSVMLYSYQSAAHKSYEVSNVFASLPRTSQVEARKRIIGFLKNESLEPIEECFIPLGEVTNHFPCRHPISLTSTAP